MYKMFPLLHFLSVIEIQVIYQCILFYFSVVLLDSSKFSNLKNWTAHINGQSDSNTGVSKASKNIQVFTDRKTTYDKLEI